MTYNRGKYYESEDDAIRYTLDDSDVDVNYSDDNNNDSDIDFNDGRKFDPRTLFTTAGSDVSDALDVKEDDQGDANDLTTNVSTVEMWSGTSFKPDLPDFDGTLRLSDNIPINFPQHPSPIDIFRLFLTPETTGYIVDQSNLYRTQNNLIQQSPMTEDDFHSLLGFLYFSSIVPLPSKSDYWSSSCRQATVADSITRDRVDYLLSILHLHDNTIEQDKAEKIEPLIHFFNESCLTAVSPEMNISIDEQMVGYRGKSAPKSFKQYMPNKPTKRGYKFWAKCGVSGFVYEVKLYHGAKKVVLNESTAMPLKRSLRSTTATSMDDKEARFEANQRDTNVKEFGVSSVVVLDFLEHTPIGSRIFVNNYFASFKLMKRMTDLGYGITCTLRPNRISKCPIPSENKMKNKPRGYYESFISDDEHGIIIAWKDNKRVILGSNCVGEDPPVKLKRWNKDEGSYIQVQAPQVIVSYNKHMGGVDTLDMMIALHPIPFRSKKWYTRIIWRILDLMVINSWILTNHLGRARGEIEGAGNWRKFRLFNFKNEIAKFLLHKPQLRQTRFSAPLSSINKNPDPVVQSSDDDNDDQEEPKKKRKRENKLAVEKTLRYDSYNHLPKFIKAKNASRCKKERCKQKTYWYCTKCHVHLCLTPLRNCFNEYHIKS